MESLKIRDRKPLTSDEEIENAPENAVEVSDKNETLSESAMRTEEVEAETPAREKRGLTFGQSLMEKVKKFFEEVE